MLRLPEITAGDFIMSGATEDFGGTNSNLCKADESYVGPGDSTVKARLLSTCRHNYMTLPISA